MMKWGNWRKWLQKDRRASAEPAISQDKVPYHVAIIADGNGRWARQRGMPRVAGHHSGMKTIKKITIAADQTGVKVLTLYVFSTENWVRPHEEVDYIMKLPQEFLLLELEEIIARNVQVRIIGVREGLPEHTVRALDEAVEKTKMNTGLILNFALNYGSRREVVSAARAMLADARDGLLQPEQVDETTFAAYLQTAGLPDPDLLIRTSGEYRLSNFMLWQLAYTEFWFTPVYWPEFSERHFYEAIAQYQQRKRRYGGL